MRPKVERLAWAKSDSDESRKRFRLATPGLSPLKWLLQVAPFTAVIGDYVGAALAAKKRAPFTAMIGEGVGAALAAKKGSGSPHRGCRH